MRFASPEFLWLYAAAPVLVLASWRAYVRRRHALRRFAGGIPFADRFTGDVSPHRRAIKLLLLYAGLLALPLSLARPQWGTRLEPITRQGSDVVVAIDTSLSMATEDLAPSRLEQAKHAVSNLLERLEGNRVGLVAFAGQASLVCPLTVDHAAALLFMDALDVESVPTAGTSLSEALQVALKALERESAKAEDRGRSIVLFSDGEDHEGRLDGALSALKDAGVAVYVVGCGTTRGAPIPLKDPTGMLTGYKKDREGKVVTTRLDEDTLERIALDTGGRYYRATSGELEVEEIAQALNALEAGEIGAQLRTRYEERFQVPLAVAVLALTLETFLGDRRRRKGSAEREKEAA